MGRLLTGSWEILEVLLYVLLPCVYILHVMAGAGAATKGHVMTVRTHSMHHDGGAGKQGPGDPVTSLNHLTSPGLLISSLSYLGEKETLIRSLLLFKKYFI